MQGDEKLFVKAFLGALAKRGASNSLILLEDKVDQGNKTSAFFAIESYAFGKSLNLLDIFWNLLDSFRVF